MKSIIKDLSPLRSIAGVNIEDKGITVTIHYRLTPNPQAVEREILNAATDLNQANNFRVICGKMTINLLPPIEIDKGTATLGLIQESQLQGGLYLGDDLTDIDAFRAIHSATDNRNFQGHAIGITSPEIPEKLELATDFTLADVRDVARFLKWLSQSVLGLS